VMLVCRRMRSPVQGSYRPGVVSRAGDSRSVMVEPSVSAFEAGSFAIPVPSHALSSSILTKTTEFDAYLVPSISPLSQPQLPD
jgi:hypothetical protein